MVNPVNSVDVKKDKVEDKKAAPLTFREMQVLIEECLDILRGNYEPTKNIDSKRPISN